jgi:hypothetical protein
MLMLDNAIHSHIDFEQMKRLDDVCTVAPLEQLALRTYCASHASYPSP